MLGVSNYEPSFFSDSNKFRVEFASRLRKIVGKNIKKFWVMWDKRENEFFPDGPIVLEIEGDQYEFCASELDKFSLTINNIDLNKNLNWYGMGDELPLIWKENGKEELKNYLNRQIEEINILTYNFVTETISDIKQHENIGKKSNTGFMLHGIEFVLKEESQSDEKNFFSVFNALDQNGITNIEISQNDQIRRIPISI